MHSLAQLGLSGPRRSRTRDLVTWHTPARLAVDVARLPVSVVRALRP